LDAEKGARVELMAEARPIDSQMTRLYGLWLEVLKRKESETE
jgi:hypothetical protein